LIIVNETYKAIKMKFKIFLLLFALTVPFTIASGQEKNEKKIKVVINNGSGEKTVLDTTITDGNFPETITTKDGKVIFIEKPVSHSEPGKVEKILNITVTDDADGKTEETEKIIIMSGDRETWTTTSTSDGTKHVQVFASAEAEGDGLVKHIIETATDDENGSGISKGGNVYVITKEKSIYADSGREGLKVDVKSGDIETKGTRYIIAKDGVVITVESDDEAKAKEIVRKIENITVVKNESSEIKESKKSESKKGVNK
jgi:hypothetical protein